VFVALQRRDRRSAPALLGRLTSYAASVAFVVPSHFDRCFGPALLGLRNRVCRARVPQLPFGAISPRPP
jgi:hypothetical protein